MADTTDLQRLVVSLEAKLNNFDKAMKRMEGQTDKTLKGVERRFKKTEGLLAGFGKNLGAGFLGGLSAAGLAAFAQSAIKDLAEIKDNAERAGLSIKDMQKLTFAALKSGGGASDIVDIFQKFNKLIGEAKAKGGDLAELLAANNVSLVDANGHMRKNVDIWFDVVNLIKNAANETDRERIAVLAMGRSAGDLKPLFLEGADGIKEMGEQAEKAGFLIDANLIKKADKFDDAWSVTWERWKNNAKAAIVGALPEGDTLTRKYFAGAGKTFPFGRGPAWERGGRGGTPATVVPVEATEEEKAAIKAADKAAKDAAREAERRAEAIAKVIEGLRFEREQLHRTDREREIYNQLAAAGVDLDSQHGKIIADLTGKFYDEQKAIEEFTDAMDEARELTRSFFGDLISGLREGASLTDILSQAFTNLADKAIDKLLDQVVDGLMGASGTSGTGFLGQLLGLVGPAGPRPSLPASAVSGASGGAAALGLAPEVLSRILPALGKGNAVGSAGMFGADTFKGGASSNFLRGGLGTDEIGAYIAQAASARGIDPATALKVWAGEGKGAWQSNLFGGKFGKREPSYGPFQLLRGGGGTGYKKGLGNDAPFDVSDPATWKQNVDFALDHAKKEGWGAWMGAKAQGVTGMEGIGGAPVQQAAQQFQQSVKTVADTAKTAAADFQTFIPATQNVVQTVAKTLSSLGGTIGFSGMDFTSLFTSGLGPVSGGLFGGGRAAGGPVNPGMIYKVHKDELIMPRVPGIVIPRGGSGTGSAGQMGVKVFPSKYFDVHVERISAAGDGRTMNQARRSLPEVQSTYNKLGTTSR